MITNERYSLLLKKLLKGSLKSIDSQNVRQKLLHLAFEYVRHAARNSRLQSNRIR